MATNLPDPGTLAPLLTKLCRDLGCRGWVGLALPDEVLSLRSVLTEQVPARPTEARRFLRWQARDLLPFPAEEARLDFLPGLATPDGRQRIVCLMARERVLAEYERLLSEAGLQAARVDARSVMLAQAASRRLGQRAAGVVAFGAGRMTLLVVEEARPRFWRTLAVAEPLEAQERERVIREVADSLAFSREAEETQPVQELLLDGPESLTEGLAAELGEWLEIPVSPLQPAAFGLGGGVARIPDVARWGAVIGAAVAPWWGSTWQRPTTSISGGSRC
jgi:Tfp pilus assembly PilM family ATPase